ncbi:MAG: hypothetical protein AAFX85_15460, partial [Pseudomonadota bacterium]
FSLASCDATPQESTAVLVQFPQAHHINPSDDDVLALVAPTGHSDWLGSYVLTDEASLAAVSIWRSESAANAFFGEAWHQRANASFGAAATLRRFQVPAQTAGGASGAARESAVMSIVSVPVPWYAPGWVVRKRISESVARYRDVAGLDRKLFTIASQSRHAGGIYLWTSRSQAEAFFNDAWRQRILETYGEPADVYFGSVAARLGTLAAPAE